ncbi:MAG TPA: class I tRNA ligase family protein, partial [Candidatus Paceibacterota bacterium]|nr:class I tRNA ligase family protein [Candidatus Paceibacterota bacterium]
LYYEYFNTKNVKSHKKVNTKKFEIIINKTIKKVEEDISTFGFNTAISAMMECLNVLTDNDEEIKFIPKSVLEKFIIILSPFAPFITEEIWHEMFKNKTSIQKAV